MKFKTAKKSLLYLWWLYLFASALGIFSIIFLFLVGYKIIFFTSITIAVLAFLFFFVYYIPTRYRGFSYKVNADMIIMKNGVFRKKITITQTNNIQFVVQKTSILERLFSISSIIARTSGGGKIVIFGLAKEESRNILLSLAHLGEVEN